MKQHSFDFVTTLQYLLSFFWFFQQPFFFSFFIAYTWLHFYGTVNKTWKNHHSKSTSSPWCCEVRSQKKPNKTMIVLINKRKIWTKNTSISTCNWGGARAVYRGSLESCWRQSHGFESLPPRFLFFGQCFCCCNNKKKAWWFRRKAKERKAKMVCFGCFHIFVNNTCCCRVLINHKIIMQPNKLLCCMCSPEESEESVPCTILITCIWLAFFPNQCGLCTIYWPNNLILCSLFF